MQAAQAQTEIGFWQAFTGRFGDLVATQAETFNTSQSDYAVIAIHKGNYSETLYAGSAAFRAGEQPGSGRAYQRDGRTGEGRRGTDSARRHHSRTQLGQSPRNALRRVRQEAIAAGGLTDVPLSWPRFCPELHSFFNDAGPGLDHRSAGIFILQRKNGSDQGIGVFTSFGAPIDRRS
jgi:hypothetical protein